MVNAGHGGKGIALAGCIGLDLEEGGNQVSGIWN